MFTTDVTVSYRNKSHNWYSGINSLQNLETIK